MYPKSGKSTVCHSQKCCIRKSCLNGNAAEHVILNNFDLLLDLLRLLQVDIAGDVTKLILSGELWTVQHTFYCRSSLLAGSPKTAGISDMFYHFRTNCLGTIDFIDLGFFPRKCSGWANFVILEEVGILDPISIRADMSDRLCKLRHCSSTRPEKSARRSQDTTGCWSSTLESHTTEPSEPSWC